MTRRQFRLYVPDNDPVSLEWCENQGRDLSVAIRQLIQKEARKNGTQSMFASELDETHTSSEPVKKPLPKKQVTKPVPTNTTNTPSIDDDLNNMMM